MLVFPNRIHLSRQTCLSVRSMSWMHLLPAHSCNAPAMTTEASRCLLKNLTLTRIVVLSDSRSSSKHVLSQALSCQALSADSSGLHTLSCVCSTSSHLVTTPSLLWQVELNIITPLALMFMASMSTPSADQYRFPNRMASCSHSALAAKV